MTPTISPDGALFAAVAQFATARRDDTCYVWNRQTGKLDAQLGSPDEPVHWIALTSITITLRSPKDDIRQRVYLRR